MVVAGGGGRTLRDRLSGARHSAKHLVLAVRCDQYRDLCLPFRCRETVHGGSA